MSRIPIFLPIKRDGNKRWVLLGQIAPSHIILSEKCTQINENYSHFGGHRVRAWAVKGNVHWLLPDAAEEYDITGVSPSQAPRRRQPR